MDSSERETHGWKVSLGEADRMSLKSYRAERSRFYRFDSRYLSNEGCISDDTELRWYRER